MNDGLIEVKVELPTERVGVVAASGYVNNEGGEAIAAAAQGLLDQNRNDLLIDLAGTRIINSIGISILLELLEKVLDRSGSLSFCNLTPTVAKTFEIMGLSQYASIYPDRPSALGDLQARAGGDA